MSKHKVELKPWGKLVYKRINGKVEVEDVDLRQVLSGRVIRRWYGKKYPEGKFMYDLVLLAGQIYVIEEWIPAEGYSWSELNVYDYSL